MGKFHIAMDLASRLYQTDGQHVRGERRFRQDDMTGDRRGGRGHGGRGSKGGGAQTFRRGRAIEFYKSLQSKEDTLKQQLEAKEFASIRPTIAVELKTVQAIRAEFKTAFGIVEEDLVDAIVIENEENSD